MKQFKGRVIVKGAVQAKALVYRTDVNFQASNSELFGKAAAGKALCLSRAVGTVTGGISLCAVGKKNRPACLLFAEHIDTITASGVILAEDWLGNAIPTVDNLGNGFLDAVGADMTVLVSEDGTVTLKQ